MANNTFTTNEKVEYALKTALLLTTSNPYMPTNQELLAPPRVFPSNVNSKDLITIGEGDIGSDGNYVTGHDNEGQPVDLNKPWNTIQKYRIIDPHTRKTSNRTISTLLITNFITAGPNSSSSSYIKSSGGDGYTFDPNGVYDKWYYRYYYPNSGNDNEKWDTANQDYPGLNLAYNSVGANVNVPSGSSNEVPHLKVYLQVQTKMVPGSDTGSRRGQFSDKTEDSISYFNPLMRNMCGPETLAQAAVQACQGTGYGITGTGRDIKQIGYAVNEWYVQPTAGLLSFYALNKSGQGTMASTEFPSKSPFISFIRYTGPVGELGGGGSFMPITDELSVEGDIYYNKGNVGIGTQTPQADLDIESTSDVALLKITRNWTNSNGSPGSVSINIGGHAGYGNITSTGFLSLKANDTTNNGQTYQNDPQLFLDINGRVGIGTQGPAEKLDVNGNLRVGTYIDVYNGLHHYIRIAGDSGNGNITLKDQYQHNSNRDKVKIQASGYTWFNGGNVGIGTKSPEVPLVVSASKDNHSNATVRDSDADSGCTNLFIRNSHPGYGGSQNYQRAALRFQHSTTSNNWGIRTQAALISEPSHSNNHDGSKFYIYTRKYGDHASTNGGDFTSSLMIDHYGNVGISTNTPNCKLDVRGSICANNDTDTASYIGRAAVGFCGYSDHMSIAHYDCNTSVKYALLQSAVGETYLNCASGRNINFRENNSTKMFIKSGGNVGIGTSSPHSKLDVRGSICANNATDTTSYIGQAAVGYCGHSNYMSIAHYLHNTTGSYALLQSSGGETYLNCASGRNINFRENNSTKMILRGGKVGINNTNPSFMLDVNGNAFVKGDFKTNGTIIANYKISAYNTINAYSDLSVSRTIYSGGTITANDGNIQSNTIMYLNWSKNHDISIANGGGNVVVGSWHDDRYQYAKLNIFGHNNENSIHYGQTSGDARTGKAPYSWVMVATRGKHNHWGWDAGYFRLSLYTNYGIWCGHLLFVESDERIKTNIRDISDTLSLQKLRDISCCYYNYKDYIKRGPSTTVGFIAQQVKEHVPEAVSIQTKIIPNEFRVIEDYSWLEVICDESNNIIENKIYDESGNDITKYKYKLTINDLSDNSGNILYRFHVSNDISGNDECEKEIRSLSDDPKSFIFEKKWNSIFLYGNEVNDFHLLDKNKLFTINFSATQEIDRIQQQEKAKLEEAKSLIDDLLLENDEINEKLNTANTKISNLETQLTTSNNRISNLESQIIDILSRISELEN